MKKILAAILTVAVSTAHAQWSFDNSPGRVFDMKKNITTQTQISITYVKPANIQSTCEAKSRELGYNGFGFGVQACSWYWEDHCIMILPEYADMRMIGHEFMHCLQGAWHP